MSHHNTHTYNILTEKDIMEVSNLSTNELHDYAQEIQEEILQFEKDHEPPLCLNEQEILNTMNEWMTVFTKEKEMRHAEETKSKMLEEMSSEELEQAYHEICDERKDFSRMLRGKVWSEFDKQQYESMNCYAKNIVDEQDRRPQSKKN
jgi:hypothetical protein